MGKIKSYKYWLRLLTCLSMMYMMLLYPLQKSISLLTETEYELVDLESENDPDTEDKDEKEKKEEKKEYHPFLSNYAVCFTHYKLVDDNQHFFSSNHSKEINLPPPEHLYTS